MRITKKLYPYFDTASCQIKLTNNKTCLIVERKMKPIKTRPFISITGQDWSYVLHHYTRDREKLLLWRGEGYPIYTYNMHLLCD